MPKQQQPEMDFTRLGKGEANGLMYKLSNALAIPTEPMSAIFVGKNYYRENVIHGLAVQLCWMVAFPRHEAILTQFLMLWMAAVAVQVVVAHLNHHFGRRENTLFVGYPLVSYVIPGVGFCRRIVTPALVFGVGTLIDDRALSLLIRWSAVGQFLSNCFAYAIKQADDDARSDAMLRR